MITHPNNSDRSVDEQQPPDVAAGMMSAMPYGSGEITKELSDAFSLVLGRVPRTPEPVVVLAWYLDSLAREYGLSDSLELDVNPLERVDPPPEATSLINHYLAADQDSLDPDSLRDRLYSVFVELSQDRDVRSTLNRNQPLTDLRLLYLSQIYWNLEGNDDRPKLPIRAGERIIVAGKESKADIRVPNANKDFATMKWAARVNEKGHFKSSGQSFRKQGARLAVFAAQHLIGRSPLLLPSLDGAMLETNEEGARIAAIVWPSPQSTVSEPVLMGSSRADGSLTLIGRPVDPGASYQRRGFDTTIENSWADGGDRRVWLVGGPGLGKSQSAGRVAQEVIACRDPDREALLIWVDSADTASVTAAFAEAVDRLVDGGLSISNRVGDPEEVKAQALLDVLATSAWRWLIVLDNADVSQLIEARLVPPGRNPSGRVLITSMSQDPRLGANGHVVSAELFTSEEADGYLRTRVHTSGRGHGVFSPALVTELNRLAGAVGYHPLALSIAAGTIVANAMTIEEWIDDFRRAPVMDDAADEPDAGGYPHLIGAAWQVAFVKASHGLPDGVVERAAMVAALQDPNGHPTWLWDTEAVAEWVAGDLAHRRRGRMPVAVRRLIEHGILELRGDAWKHGRLAIHQLAARAVREQADPTATAELAAILVDQWLLQLTGDASLAHPRDLRTNLRPIAALPGLPTETTQAVKALLRYGGVADDSSLRVSTVAFEDIAPHLDRGGATGLAELADRLGRIGDELSELGRVDEAQANYSRAARIHQDLLGDRSVDSQLRAESLYALGEFQVKLGQDDEAHASFVQAAKLFERLVETDPDSRHLDSFLAGLVMIYDKLDNPDKKRLLLTRAEELLARVRDHTPGETGTDLRAAAAWLRLASTFRALGRQSEAGELLGRAAEVFERGGDRFGLKVALERLADLRIADAEWSVAEDVLTRLLNVVPFFPRADWQVRLASVLKRQGRTNEALVHLQDAAGNLDHQTDEARAAPPTELSAEVIAETRAFRLVSVDAVLLSLLSSAMENNRWADAVGLCQARLDVLQLRAQEDNTVDEAELADAHLFLGASYAMIGRLDSAAEHYTRAISIREILADLDPSNEQKERALSQALMLLGEVQAGSGLPEAAVSALSRATSILGCKPGELSGLDQALGILTSQYAQLGRESEAIASAKRRLDAWQAQVDAAPQDLDAQRGLAEACGGMGWSLLKFGKLDDAHESLSRSVTLWENVSRRSGRGRTARASLINARLSLGANQLARGCSDDAIHALSLAVADAQELVDESPTDDDLQVSLARALAGLAMANDQSGELQEAIEHFSRSVKILEVLAELAPRKHEPILLTALQGLAYALTRLGREAEAGEVSARADDLIRRFPELNA